jgi:hypothetical protein
MLACSARRWSCAAIASGGAALIGWNSMVADSWMLSASSAEPLDKPVLRSKDVAAAVAAPSAGSHVKVVAILKNDFQACESCWEMGLADMAQTANLGAVDKDFLAQWLANFDVASSSAKVARSFVRDDYDNASADEDDEFEALYLFYLHSGGFDSHQQGCMQVRVGGDVLTIDALCSLGNHSGEAFMRHLVEWVPAEAPRVSHIAVMPLSDGWLRQEYYARLGFVSKPDGSGVMTRGVEAFSEAS